MDDITLAARLDDVFGLRLEMQGSAEVLIQGRRRPRGCRRAAVNQVGGECVVRRRRRRFCRCLAASAATVVRCLRPEPMESVRSKRAGRHRIASARARARPVHVQSVVPRARNCRRPPPRDSALPDAG